jgi:hypothetical protein
MHPNLVHIRRVTAITTYGRSRRDAWWMGDPPRKLITRYLRWFVTRYPRWFVARNARIRYLAQYDLHRSEGTKHRRFLDRVAASMRNL